MICQLGKAALCILQAKDILQMLVNETEGTNQLVESCRIYLSSKLFITELECLAYFNHYVTFPFLNCTEVSSQIQLIEILPKLYSDLTDGKIDTLQNYVVSVHGISSPVLTNNLSTKILKMMCTSAASAVKLQCGREYGFGDDKARATDLSLLNGSDLEGLPTNNLIAERDLSRFDREANLAKSRSRRFKTKNIQKTWYFTNLKWKSNLKSCQKNSLSSFRIVRLIRILCSRKNSKKKLGEVKEKLESKRLHKKLLRNCKSWGGPCTTVEELQEILKKKCDQDVHIIKIELAYHAYTHKANNLGRPDLFRLNDIS